MRRIVVGVREAAGPDAALDFALSEACRRQLPVVVVHCAQGLTYGELPLWAAAGVGAERAAAATALATRALARALVRFPEHRGLDAQPLGLEGSPVDGIAALVSGAALVVVGTRNRRHDLGGWVGLGVAQRSLAPLVLVPHNTPAVPERWLRSRVLVGVDGSPASLSALAWAAAQAQEWECPLLPLVVSDADGRPPRALAAKKDELSAVLHRLVQDTGSEATSVHPHLLTGAASHELRAAARPEDVLVLGADDRGWSSGAPAAPSYGGRPALWSWFARGRRGARHICAAVPSGLRDLRPAPRYRRSAEARTKPGSGGGQQTQCDVDHVRCYVACIHRPRKHGSHHAEACAGRDRHRGYDKRHGNGLWRFRQQGKELIG